jgi:hypothetical protein
MISVTAFTLLKSRLCWPALLLAGATACATPAREPSHIRGEVPETILSAIRTDMENQSDITDIRLIRAEAMTWRSGAMGCPQPGMLYTQALVEGYHVIYEAGGRTWDYRVGRGGRFRLCKPAKPGGSDRSN